MNTLPSPPMLTFIFEAWDIEGNEVAAFIDPFDYRIFLAAPIRDHEPWIFARSFNGPWHKEGETVFQNSNNNP
jgi:hypothetical protein